MKYQDNQIDSLFRERLGSLEKAPPPMVWENIQKEIPRNGNRKKGMFWLFSSAAALMLLATGIGIGILIGGKGNAHTSGHQLLAFGLDLPQINLQLPAILRPEAPKETVVSRKNNSRPAIQSLAVIQAGNKVPVAQQVAMATMQSLPVNSPYDHEPKANRHIPMPKLQWVDEATEAKGWITYGDESSKKNKAEWTVGGSFSPAFAMGGTSDKLADQSPFTSVESITSSTQNQVGFATGVDFGVRFNDRVGLESGVLFTQRKGVPDYGNQLNRSFYEEASSLNAFSDRSTPSGEFTASYMEIPVGVKYNLLKGKILSLYVNPGISGSFLLNYQASQQISADQTLTEKVEHAPLQPAQLSAIASGGLSVKLFKGMHLNVEPNFRMPVVSSPYAFMGNSNGIAGINTGLQYHF
ncbi:MAG: PorT family protein [Bacteroidia bacterium]|nr:PorT family protein [Bacteroidia bacterium]